MGMGLMCHMVCVPRRILRTGSDRGVLKNLR